MFTKAFIACVACWGFLLGGAHGQEAFPGDAPVLTARAPGKSAGTQPSCELKASPNAILAPGQQVKISWSTQRATSATLDQFPGAIPLDGKNAFLDDRPKATKTYRMAVVGPGGTSTCRISVAVPERTEPLSWPPAALSGLPADYLARARESLTTAITSTRPMSDLRWVFYATSSLLFEQDTKAINAYFSDVWEVPQHPEWGFGLFSLDSVRLYGLFNERSGTFPGRLSAAAQRHIEGQFHKVVSQTKFNDYRFVSDIGNWRVKGSENHAFAAQSSFLLTSQFLKNSPEFATRRYEDGRTPGEHYEAWRRTFSVLLDERAKRGIYIEVASPSYEDETRQAIQNIRDFAEDPALRKKAEMLLDLSYAIIAQETLKGVRGGAKSRVYSFRESFWEGGADRAYNLIFGPPSYVPLNVPVQATSTYFPPVAVVNLAKDESSRGSYEIVQRVPGVGVSASSKSAPSVIASDKSIYRYAFATPTYVIGSFVLDPAESHVGASRQNRWQGVTFSGQSGSRIAPQVTRLRKDGSLDSEQRVSDGFASLQTENVLITQRSKYQTGYAARTDVYFSNTLDVVEEGGWIFAREGQSYAAVKVIAPSAKAYEWIDPGKKNKNEDRKKNYITLADTDAPIIIVANQASDYNGDFEKFKAAIKAAPVRQSAGELVFATLTFNGPQKIGSRNGTPVDISPTRLYDSPFIRSDWASGVIFIRKGNDALKLDFRNPDRPSKTVDVAITSDYPNGRGAAKPIVFEVR